MSFDIPQGTLDMKKMTRNFVNKELMPIDFATWTSFRRFAPTGRPIHFSLSRRTDIFTGVARDMKDSDAALVETFLRLLREGYKPRRDLILALTADEEGGKFNGADWLVRVPAGLDRQIDTPRLYRLEQLPRALPWETVRKLLQSIDRTSPMGLRDYAMFLLIATYGLRASEVVSISLEDIRWRQRSLRIHQRKTSSPLELPLTNEVLSALVKHLKRTPPPAPYRRVFLRMRAPIGTLKPTAVTEAFQALVRKSGLSVPYQGPHCLRHSYVVCLSEDHRRHLGTSYRRKHVHVSAVGHRGSARSGPRSSG